MSEILRENSEAGELLLSNWPEPTDWPRIEAIQCNDCHLIILYPQLKTRPLTYRILMLGSLLAKPRW